ncbi:MAG: hypothetical protein V3U76_17515 [Granulosicoccus sp.]
MKHPTLAGLSLFLAIISGCAKEETDYCQYLSIDEAKKFNATIDEANMHQAELMKYCIYGKNGSTIMAVSLDQSLNYHPAQVLRTIAKHAPRKYDEVIALHDVGDQAAVLFSGDKKNKAILVKLIAQNKDYSILIDTPELASPKEPGFEVLKNMAGTILSRI